MLVVMQAALALTAVGLGPPSAEDVIRGLEDAERILGGFSVASLVEATDVSPRTGKPTVRNSQVTFTVDASGRSRYKAEQLDDAGRVVRAIVEAYDGQEFRSVEGSGRPFEAYQFGRVTSSEGDRTWPIDPRDFVGSFGGHPVSSLIRAHGVESVSTEEWEGRTVVKLATRPVAAERTYRGEYLIAPELGFAVVRKTDYVSVKPGAEWQVYQRIESRGHREAEANVWLPASVDHEVFRVPNSGPAKLLSRKTFRNDGWAPNEAVAAATFALDFPEGVFVEDAVRGARYKSAKVTDQILADSAAEARTALMAAGGVPGRPGPGPGVLLTASGVAALSVASLGWAARRRRSRPPSGRGALTEAAG